jgi:osmotically-inducible protein OsmY
LKPDTKLQHDVQAELEWEPSVDATQIGVLVKDGVITLVGHVTGYAQKTAAERVAKRVAGVKAVANDIAVRLPESDERTDGDIAGATVNAFNWDTRVPAEKIKVCVRDGWVTLESEVDWHYQKEAAEHAVRCLTGVKGVTNLIAVKPKGALDEVKQKIEEAFLRNAVLDAECVKVEAYDGKVILNGRVKSWNELDEAVRAAWSAPGVSWVESHLVVDPWSGAEARC